MLGRGRSQRMTDTSESRRITTPEQDEAIRQFLTFQGGMLSDPSAGLSSMRAAQMGAINTAYASGGDDLQEYLGRLGIRPDSGAGVAAQTSLIRDRSRAMTGLDRYLAELAQQRKQQAAGALGNFGMANFGSSTTSTRTTPRNMLGAFAEGASDMGGFLIGQKYFK